MANGNASQTRPSAHAHGSQAAPPHASAEVEAFAGLANPSQGSPAVERLELLEQEVGQTLLFGRRPSGGDPPEFLGQGEQFVPSFGVLAELSEGEIGSAGK